MSYWVASRADLLRLHVVCTEPYVFVFVSHNSMVRKGFRARPWVQINHNTHTMPKYITV